MLNLKMNQRLISCNQTMNDISLQTIRVYVFSAVAQQTQQLLLLIGNPPIGIRIMNLSVNQNMCYITVIHQAVNVLLV